MSVSTILTADNNYSLNINLKEGKKYPVIISYDTTTGFMETSREVTSTKGLIKVINNVLGTINWFKSKGVLQKNKYPELNLIIN